MKNNQINAIEDATETLQSLTQDLDNRATNMFWSGLFIVALSFGAAIYLYIDIRQAIDKQVDIIKDSGDKAILITVYLIFRILTLGGIVTALLIFGYNMIKATLDQSVRFSKRKHAALFLEFLHKEYADKITSMEFKELMAAFETWNKTTESSFTNIKISNRNFFANALENFSTSLRELKERLDKK